MTEEYWPLLDKVVLYLLALLIKMMRMTRKRHNTAKAFTAEPNMATKLNTNKPAATKTCIVKSTANKTACTVVQTDMAKPEAAELEAKKPEAATQRNDGGK